MQLGIHPRLGHLAPVFVLAATLALAAPRTAHALRELSTDRPDRTESAYSVDAGHLQLEMDGVAFGHDEEGGQRARATALAVINGKLGLTPNLDLQFIALSYVRERLDGGDVGASQISGFGGGAVRLKLNLFGNDGGPRALALMPFVEFPNRGVFPGAKTEGGLIVPYAQALPGGFGLGAMFQADARADEAGDGYHAEWVGSATVSHDISGPLGGYVELYSRTSFDAGAPWRGTADAGLTWALGDRAQLDLGANVGLSEASEDLVVFLGFAVKR